MKGVWQRFFKRVSLGLFAVLLTVFLASCGGGGSSGGTTTTTTDTTTDTTTTDTTTDTTTTGTSFSGSSKITGTVGVSSLSSMDQQNLTKAAGLKAGKPFNKVSLAAARQATSTENAVVKLYVVGSDGELEDTGIDCVFTGEVDANGDPAYECDGVKDGVNYVVKYLKIVDGNQAIEMKVDVEVPVGETSVVTDTISPQTTVIVDTIVNAILEATAGTGIDQTVVDTIIDAVKATIVTLVESGIIQIPDMTVEAPKDADGNYITDVTALDATEATFDVNDDVSSAAGVLLSDETVDAGLGVVKNDTISQRFVMANVTTATAKRGLVQRVFDELVDDEEGGGAPDFIINFLSDKFIADETATVTALMNAVVAGLEWRPDIDVSSLGLTKDGAIAAFVQALADLYALLDKKDAGTLTSDESLELADFPPVIQGLFPVSERSTWENLTGSTSLNIPQGIALVVFVIDEYIEESFADQVDSKFTAEAGDGGAGMSFEMEEPVDFNPMKPGSIMDILGFYDVYQDYAGLDVFDLWINPGRAWIEGGSGDAGQEVDMLMGGTCFADVASMVAHMRPDLGTTFTDYSSATVTLTYPKVDGSTGTVSLINEARLWGGDGGMMGGEVCFALDPWIQGVIATPGYENWTPSDPWPSEYIQPSPIISDFVSGTYTVSITHSSLTEPVTESFTKTVITGMTNARPVLTEPRSFPEWPGDGAAQSEMDAFDSAMEEYNKQGPSVFSANVMSDGSDPLPGQDATHAKVTAKWTAPTDVTLPDGVKIGYELDVGSGGCDDSGCTWNHIYATWERNKILYGTSFTIPVPLVKSATTRYEIHMHVVFIDTATGERLGEGGSTHAEFYISDPVDRNATFTITGKAAEGYKVALVREEWDQSSFTSTRTVVVESDVVNQAYTLTPRISDFLDYPGSWFNIIEYQDTNTAVDGFDDLDIQVWPDPGANMWFDAWGGILRVGRETCQTDATSGEVLWHTCEHSEETIRGGETVIGPSWVTADPTATFTISGTAPDGFTAAVVKEYWDENSFDPYQQEAIATFDVVSSAYTLNLTVGNFLDTTHPDAWYSLILFEDGNNSGGFDKSDPKWWPDGNFWFDTWGGKIRIGKETCSTATDPATGATYTDWSSCTYSETEIFGGEVVTGPSFLTIIDEIANDTGQSATDFTFQQPVSISNILDASGASIIGSATVNDFNDFYTFSGYSTNSITVVGSSNVDQKIDWYFEGGGGALTGFNDYASSNGDFSITFNLGSGWNYIDLCDMGPYCIYLEFNNTAGGGIVGTGTSGSKLVEITSPAHNDTASGTVTVSGTVDVASFAAAILWADVCNQSTWECSFYSSDTFDQQQWGDLPLTYDSSTGAFSFNATIGDGVPTEIWVEGEDSSGHSWHGHTIYVNNTNNFDESFYKPGQKAGRTKDARDRARKMERAKRRAAKGSQ